MEEYQFGEENLQVKRQEVQINGEIVESLLKTKNAYWTLPLAENSIQILKQQKKSRQQPLGIPITHWCANLSGQRPTYAPACDIANGIASG